MFTVTLAIPSMDEWKAVTSQCLMALVGHTMAHVPGINLGTANRRSSMVTGNRNDLVTEILKHGTDYILWIDTDMMFPANALVRLLRHGQDLVGATYNKRVAPYETCGRFVPPIEGHPAKMEGLVEAEFLPTGMFLMKAHLFQRLAYPWFYETYWPPQPDEMDNFLVGLQDRSFIPLKDEVANELRQSPALAGWLKEEQRARLAVCGPGRTMSEDYNFSRKAKMHGLRIWCDLDLTYEMGHVGEQVVTSARPPAVEATT